MNKLYSKLFSCRKQREEVKEKDKAIDKFKKRETKLIQKQIQFERDFFNQPTKHIFKGELKSLNSDINQKSEETNVEMDEHVLSKDDFKSF
jgi:hypothetical protein